MSALSLLRAPQDHRTKVAAVLAHLHRDERRLSHALHTISDRHRVDHEVFYGARDLAAWSEEHVQRLAAAGPDYGVQLDARAGSPPGLLARAQRTTAELIGRRHVPAMLLLLDLRDIHQRAASISVEWEMLAQTAQATKDNGLLALVQECHPETLRQMRWANAKIKETAAQAMS